MDLSMLPDTRIVLSTEEGCEFTNCPFFGECYGGENSKNRDGGFVCDTKRLKVYYNVKISDKG